MSGRIDLATTGADGYIGTPGQGGTQLTPSAVSDSSGVNAPLIDRAGNKLVNIPAWQTATVYPQGYVVQQGGVAYMATATFTSGASFGVDGANWAALSSAEMGYAQITSGSPASPFVNTITPQAITGLSVTVTVASRPILVEFYGEIQNVAGNQINNGQIFIYEDGVQVARGRFVLSNAAFLTLPLGVKARRNPAAGSHTYAVYGQSDNVANTWWVNALANDPAFIRVTQG